MTDKLARVTRICYLYFQRIKMNFLISDAEFEFLKFVMFELRYDDWKSGTRLERMNIIDLLEIIGLSTTTNPIFVMTIRNLISEMREQIGKRDY